MHRLVLTFLVAIPLAAFAEEKNNTAIVPAKKNPERHERFLKDIEAKKGKIDVVFYGDSITDGWRNQKSGAFDVFKEHFEAMNTINLGISGDRTQHLIWRMQNGELDGYTPKVMMLDDRHQ